MNRRVEALRQVLQKDASGELLESDFNGELYVHGGRLRDPRTSSASGS